MMFAGITSFMVQFDVFHQNLPPLQDKRVGPGLPDIAQS